MRGRDPPKRKAEMPPPPSPLASALIIVDQRSTSSIIVDRAEWHAECMLRQAAGRQHAKAKAKAGRQQAAGSMPWERMAGSRQAAGRQVVR